MIPPARLATEETPMVINGSTGSPGFRHPARRAGIATQMGFLLRAGEDAVEGGEVQSAERCRHQHRREVPSVACRC